MDLSLSGRSDWQTSTLTRIYYESIGGGVGCFVSFVHMLSDVLPLWSNGVAQLLAIVFKLLTCSSCGLCL